MNRFKLFFSKVLVWLVQKCKVVYRAAYLTKLKSEIRYLGENPVIELPVFFMNPPYISIGKNFILRKDGKIRAHTEFEQYTYTPEIKIGDNVHIGTNCSISAIGSITIGNDVTFASNITVTDHLHGLPGYSDIDTPVMKRALGTKGPIIIEDNAWIGEGVVILSGLTIGRNAIVGANSVVTKSVPANGIVGGVPAKILKIIE